MNQGQYVFTQVMRNFPRYEFDKCVNRYSGNKRVKSFSCWDHFMCLSFGQLSYRESLSDIVVCLNAQKSSLYHLGIRGKVRKSTIADANHKRDWRIYADFAHYLIAQVHTKIAQSEFMIKEYDLTIFALDSTLIRLCLNVFFWAKYRKSKAGIKLHTLLDVQNSIPYFVHITDGIVSDMTVLKQLIFSPGAFYVMDRGYNDFKQLYRINKSNAYFVIRAKKPLKFRRQYSRQKEGNILFDQVGRFTVYDSRKLYPEQIRCIKSKDPETNKSITLLTNNFEIEATHIADFYKNRWQVELFFKWIKQHLKIKSFWGLSENAVKTQIYSALSVYLLVAKLKYDYNLKQNLYEILQILSVSLLVKQPINEVFMSTKIQSQESSNCNQLSIWEF
jgi:hypothetical protein